MRVDAADRRFTVSWKHRTKGSKKGTRVFISEIFLNADEPVLLAEGKSYLHKGDTYSKNTGRIRSLTRALEQLFPGHENRDTRNKFWEAYTKMENGDMVKNEKFIQLQIVKRIAKKLNCKEIDHMTSVEQALKYLWKQCFADADAKQVSVLTTVG